MTRFRRRFALTTALAISALSLTSCAADNTTQPSDSCQVTEGESITPGESVTLNLCEDTTSAVSLHIDKPVSVLIAVDAEADFQPDFYLTGKADEGIVDSPQYQSDELQKIDRTGASNIDAPVTLAPGDFTIEVYQGLGAQGELELSVTPLDEPTKIDVGESVDIALDSYESFTGYVPVPEGTYAIEFNAPAGSIDPDTYMGPLLVYTVGDSESHEVGGRDIDVSHGEVADPYSEFEVADDDVVALTLFSRWGNTVAGEFTLTRL